MLSTRLHYIVKGMILVVPLIIVTGCGGGYDTKVPPLPEGVKSIEASSTYPTDKSAYYPVYAIDGNSKTAWSPKRNYTVGNAGQWIKITFDESVTLKAISFINGWVKSDGLWKRNSRIEDATLEFSDGRQFKITLEDTRSLQRMNLGNITTKSVKLTIDTVYPGASYSDGTEIFLQGKNHEACLSEISFLRK